MRIAIGCDHAGFELKSAILKLLEEKGIEVRDMGTDGVLSVDYPDFGEAVSCAVSAGEADRGILICGTGIGMSIVANKFPGVRAALCAEPFSARMSRLHNDANVLVIGGRVTGLELAMEITRVWLATPFEGGRHQRRLDKIREIEKRNPCTSKS
ncbi:MAG: ribose 5-phosphate isomerase B [Thermodesulfovibrionales bacterium]